MELVDSIVGVISSVISCVAIVYAVYLTVHHFRIVRTVSFIERFHNPNMVATRVAIDEWLESTDDDDERLRAVDSDPVLKAQICLFVSFFTELGISYRHKTLDRKVAFDIWEYLVPTYWQKLEFFVNDRRAKGCPTLYESFKVLAGDMQKVPNPSVGQQ